VSENAEVESLRYTKEGGGAQLLKEFARLLDESGERRAYVLNQSKLILVLK